MAKRKGKGEPKRPAVTVYFESEAQLERIKTASRGNMSEYLRDRALFDEGFADPRHDVAALLFALAGKIEGELHLIADLVRANYAVKTELARSPAYAGDHVLRRLQDDIYNLIGRLTNSVEKRAEYDVGLSRQIREYNRACAAWELAQSRKATRRARTRPGS